MLTVSNKIFLKLVTEATFVSKLRAIMQLPAHIIKIMKVMGGSDTVES